MRRLLFLFLDGVGLGPDDIETNPLAAARMPHLESLLEGRRLVQNLETFPISTRRATLLSLDACLGVEGRPQSASGQASLLTGKNVPLLTGQHYGPKPNAAIRAIVENGNLFSQLESSGYHTALLNAYPEGYFRGIASGRRLPGVVALAALAAGIPLKTTSDLFAGQAISADFTARGWREHLDLPETPLLSPRQAGVRLAKLARAYDFAFFEYWLSDYAGHRRDAQAAQDLMATFDQVLGGLLSAWDDEEGLVLLTSDHGNLEDLTSRGHTRNPVPALVIGSQTLRKEFTEQLADLTHVYPAILRFFGLGD